MIDWKLEEFLRGKFQRGELVNQVPADWTEDQVVDYLASRYYSPTIMSKGKVQDETAPEWAAKLARVLDSFEKVILPAIERVNREKLELAQREARFYRSLETDEERGLRAEQEQPRPKKYPLEPEAYPYEEEKEKGKE
jgi:hypothetical protein